MNQVERVTLKLPSPYSPSVGTSLTVLLGGEGQVEATAWRRSASGFLESVKEDAVHAVVEVEDPTIATALHLGEDRWRIHPLAVGQCTIYVRLGTLVGQMALSVLAPQPAQRLELELRKVGGGIQVWARSRHQGSLSRRVIAEHGLRLEILGDGFSLATNGGLTHPHDGQAKVDAHLGDLHAHGVLGARSGVLTLLSMPAPMRTWKAGNVAAIPLEASTSEETYADLSGLRITSTDERIAHDEGRRIHCKSAGETTLIFNLDGLILEQRIHIDAPRIARISIGTNAGRGSMFHGRLYMSPGEDLDLRVYAEDDDGKCWVPDADGFVEVASSSEAVEIVHKPCRGLRAVAEGSAVITARCAEHTDTLEIIVSVPEINWF